MKNISFRTDVLPLKNELFRLALRITLNREEAEDVVQETMMKVWNRRDDWEKIESIEAFCLTICRNLAVDKTRRRVKDEGLRTADYGTRNTEYDIADTSYASNPEEGCTARPHPTGQDTHQRTSRETAQRHAAARHRREKL